MMRKLVDILFGCSHSNYSFPRTAKAGQRRGDAAAVTGTYVVCLDCGKEFPYDWQQMRIVWAAAKAAGPIAKPEESYATK
jgi:hypothetical protein